MGNQGISGQNILKILPIIEEPDRAITQLRNLARGAALTQEETILLLKTFHYSSK